VTLDKRLEQLEQGDSVDTIVILWQLDGDNVDTPEGVMTFAEYEQRHPGGKVVRIGWFD